MATRTIFSDDDSNEMECYLNDKGRVYINVGQKGEDIAYNGFITLDKDDVLQLINNLSDMVKEMED